jgi:hypothetical protein
MHQLLPCAWGHNGCSCARPRPAPVLPPAHIEAVQVPCHAGCFAAGRHRNGGEAGLATAQHQGSCAPAASEIDVGRCWGKSSVGGKPAGCCWWKIHSSPASRHHPHHKTRATGRDARPRCWCRRPPSSPLRFGKGEEGDPTAGAASHSRPLTHTTPTLQTIRPGKSSPWPQGARARPCAHARTAPAAGSRQGVAMCREGAEGASVWRARPCGAGGPTPAGGGGHHVWACNGVRLRTPRPRTPPPWYRPGGLARPQTHSKRAHEHPSSCIRSISCLPAPNVAVLRGWRGPALPLPAVHMPWPARALLLLLTCC